LAGIKYDDLDGAEITNVCYTMIISDIMTNEISRVEARAEFEKRLADFRQRDEIKRGIKPEAEPYHLSAAMASQMGLKIRPPKAKVGQDSQ
jgi:hypothetical protein